ncbi:MAG: hypothetical protein AMXMBFR84_08200 [Candidatus Hydrogenedentota bacterium]
MHIELSDTTQREIDGLASRIARAQGLEEDVALELHHHIEDKVIGYLSSEVPVSEADALLLASNHFGDSRLVKDLLGVAHDHEASKTFTQRLFAVATASFLAMYLPKLINAALGPVFRWADIQRQEAFVFTWSGLYTLGTAFSVFLIWRLLKRWKAREQQPGGSWYQRLKIGWLMLVLAALFAGLPFAASQYNKTMHSLMPNIVELPQRGYVYGTMAQLGLMALSAFVLIVMWPWWCDREPRTNRVIYRSCAWAASWLAMVLIVSVPMQPSNLLALSPSILAVAGFGLVAYVSYRFARWMQDQSNEHALNMNSK